MGASPGLYAPIWMPYGSLLDGGYNPNSTIRSGAGVINQAPLSLGESYFYGDKVLDNFVGANPFQQAAAAFTLSRLGNQGVADAIGKTHLSSLYSSDKYIQEQTSGIMDAFKWFQESSINTTQNEDGTYNFELPYGTPTPSPYLDYENGTRVSGGGTQWINTQIPGLSDWMRVNNSGNLSREEAAAVMGQQLGTSFTSGNLTIRNIPNLADAGKVSEYIMGGYSPLSALREEQVRSWQNAEGNSAWLPNMRADAAEELRFTQDFKERKDKINQYKRNKATSQRLSATSAGAPGTGGSDSEDALKLGIPTLLGL